MHAHLILHRFRGKKKKDLADIEFLKYIFSWYSSINSSFNRFSIFFRAANVLFSLLIHLSIIFLINPSLKWQKMVTNADHSFLKPNAKKRNPHIGKAGTREFLQKNNQNSCFSAYIGVGGSANTLYFILIPLKRLSFLYSTTGQSGVGHTADHRRFMFWPSHLLGLISHEVPNDRVFGNVWVGAVPGV